MRDRVGNGSLHPDDGGNSTLCKLKSDYGERRLRIKQPESVANFASANLTSREASSSP